MATDDSGPGDNANTSSGDHDYYRLYTPSYQAENSPADSSSAVNFALVKGVLATTESIAQPFVEIDGVRYKIIKKKRSAYSKTVFNYTLEELNG